MLTIDPKAPVILVPAIIVGTLRSHNINLILDTGATYTMISPEILLRVGYDSTSGLQKKPITTASGIKYVNFLVVASIKTFGAERHNIEVYAHSLPPTIPASGLLGLNFLRHFNININFLKGQLNISTK